MRDVEITLAPVEMWASLERARAVMLIAKRCGFHNRFTPVGETEEQVKTRGYAAEIAAARVTGLMLHWPYFGCDHKRADRFPDIGVKVEVRNARRNGGRLVAYRGNPIDWYYLLVTGEGPTFTVRGWLHGSELMVRERWDPDAIVPAWFADQYDLHELDLPPEAGRRNID